MESDIAMPSINWLLELKELEVIEIDVLSIVSYILSLLE